MALRSSSSGLRPSPARCNAATVSRSRRTSLSRSAMYSPAGSVSRPALSLQRSTAPLTPRCCDVGSMAGRALPAPDAASSPPGSAGAATLRTRRAREAERWAQARAAGRTCGAARAGTARCGTGSPSSSRCTAAADGAAERSQRRGGAQSQLPIAARRACLCSRSDPRRRLLGRGGAHLRQVLAHGVDCDLEVLRAAPGARRQRVRKTASESHSQPRASVLHPSVRRQRFHDAQRAKRQTPSPPRRTCGGSVPSMFAIVWRMASTTSGGARVEKDSSSPGCTSATYCGWRRRRVSTGCGERSAAAQFAHLKQELPAQRRDFVGAPGAAVAGATAHGARTTLTRRGTQGEARRGAAEELEAARLRARAAQRGAVPQQPLRQHR